MKRKPRNLIIFTLVSFLAFMPGRTQTFEGGFDGKSKSGNQSNQKIDYSEIVYQAQIDAKANINGGLWFMAGCLGGLTGILIAYVAQPSPPVISLMGKPAEYILIYTQAYKEAGNKLQSKYAMRGCLSLVGFYVAYVVVVLSMASSVSTVE